MIFHCDLARESVLLFGVLRGLVCGSGVDLGHRTHSVSDGQTNTV